MRLSLAVFAASCFDRLQGQASRPFQVDYKVLGQQVSVVDDSMSAYRKGERKTSKFRQILILP
jgi:hypothetical protein